MAMYDRSVTLKTAWPAACISQNGVSGPDSHFWRDRAGVTVRISGRQKRRARPWPNRRLWHFQLVTRLGLKRDAPGAEVDQSRRERRERILAAAIFADARRITARRITARRITARRITAHRITAHRITAHRITARRITARRITARRESARSRPRREFCWTPAPNATCGDPACPMATSA